MARAFVGVVYETLFIDVAVVLAVIATSAESKTVHCEDVWNRLPGKGVLSDGPSSRRQ